MMKHTRETCARNGMSSDRRGRRRVFAARRRILKSQQQKGRVEGGAIVMSTCFNQSNCAGAALSLALALVMWSAAPKASAQDRENTFGDAFTPLVYSAENTGANFPAPNFPSFAQLPIVRP